jgi:hypothetical protein
VQAAVQLSVAVILLLCGAAITKLQSTDRANSTRIPWDTTSLLYAAAKGSSATSVLANSTSSIQSASLFNLSSIISSLQGTTRGLAAGSNTTSATSSQVLSSVDSAADFVLDAATINATYASCYYELPENCSSAVKASIGSDLMMGFGQFIAWNSTVDYLLKEGLVSLPTADAGFISTATTCTSPVRELLLPQDPNTAGLPHRTLRG